MTTTKTILVTKIKSETLLNAAKRATNQANLNNKEVKFVDGAYSIIVKPFAVVKDVMIELKKIAIHQEIALLEKQISQ